MCKYLLLTAAIAVTGLTFLAAVPASAREYQWCGVYPGNAGRNCGFSSYRQCMVSVSGGGGGYCERNRFYNGRRR
jgi:hypothetical protein